jgi:hypothetical protein
MRKRDLERLVKRVTEEQARLQPLVPQISAHDLNLILSRMLRPPKERRYFHRRRGTSYVR